MQRAGLVFVIMSQEFRFVCGHVDVRRAFRFARLARQTQIERFLDVFVLPSVAHHFALQHFKEHVRAAARAVLFLERHHVAGAHRAAVVLAAFAEPDASQRGFGERSIVVRKVKISFGIDRLVVRAQAQIFGGQICVDHLVRIHLIVRIPRGLEFAESLDQFGTEHLGKQRGAGLPVAMLAGKRAAVTDHQIGGALDEFHVIADSVFALQIETHAHVNAAVPEMAVERRMVVIFVEQLPDIAQVVAQFFRRDRGVVPSFPFGRRSRRGSGGARPGLAQLPDVARFGLGVQPHVRRIGGLFQLVDQLARGFVGLGRIIRTEFHEQKAASLPESIPDSELFSFLVRRRCFLQTLRGRWVSTAKFPGHDLPRKTYRGSRGTRAICAAGFRSAAIWLRARSCTCPLFPPAISPR